MKTLQVIETAYRCNIEEQDDPAVWITHTMKGAGADLDVLLQSNAVGYAIRQQDASGYFLAGKGQVHPPDMAREIKRLIDKGVGVYVVQDDAAERGIESTDFVVGVKPISRAASAGLLSSYERIWWW